MTNLKKKGMKLSPGETWSCGEEKAKEEPLIRSVSHLSRPPFACLPERDRKRVLNEIPKL